ncbi:hypothetical protein HQ590_06035 [bacterium]|nr:hypothetical protein [bacterium]
MNKAELLGYLERIDHALSKPATLTVYGSAPCILLDEPERTSLDVDVAGPYSAVDLVDLQRAAQAAGLPVNPATDYQGDHLEWILAPRLCLPPPSPASAVVLWQGQRLTVRTVAIPELIASKLIRYDPVDQADVRYLCTLARVPFDAIQTAARSLPPPFNQDTIVRENLRNLNADMQMWQGQ